MTEQPDWARITVAFRRPFPPESIKQRAGRGGMTFDYIDARDVENRLDEVVGPGNWTDEYEVIDAPRMGFKCRLTVHGVYKEGIGYPNNPVGGKGESPEPGKDAESDALKRAAVKFGIGRHLYEDKPAASQKAKEEQPETKPANVREIKPGDGRNKLLASVMEMCGEVAQLRGKGEKPQAVLREACKSEGIEVANTGELTVNHLSVLLTWATSQRDMLRNSREAASQPRPAGRYF